MVHQQHIMMLFQAQEIQYERYQLSPTDMMIVGRDRQCGIVYDLSFISKQHCQIAYHEYWKISDLNSKNGTYLNRVRIQEAALNIGDCIQIGGCEMWFCGCFILIAKPSACTLKPFHVRYTKPMLSVNTALLQLPLPQPKPKLALPVKAGHSFSFAGDVLIPLIYPLWLLKERTSSYARMALVMVFIRWFHLLFGEIKHLWLVHRAKQDYQKAQLSYQAYLQTLYPAWRQLEHNYLNMGGLLVRSGPPIVRIGQNKNGKPIVHDFCTSPHLVLIGSKQQCEQVILQIIYQIDIYYPQIAVRVQNWLPHFWFCAACTRAGQATLRIGHEHQPGDDYWLEDVQNAWEAQAGYDAVWDLGQGKYIAQTETQVLLDEAIDRYAFSHIFAQNDRQPPSHYWQLIGLESASIQDLRQAHQIEHAFVGCIGHHQGKPLFLDLHEKKDGPHLLLAGMTGSGKSEWLLSYLYSLAVYYDATDLQFFFIDFKGGGVSQAFTQMHHTSMVLTDLEPNQMTRAIAALEDELQLREKILLEVSNQNGQNNLNIHQLKKLYRAGLTTRNFPHLMIVVDEFAELKLLYPEMMQALIRVARVGRSLGIHLVLATQRPSGVIDGQINSNIKTRICLSVSSQQDSYDVLHHPCAATLTLPGQFYCQTGQQLIYGEALMIEKEVASMIFYNEADQEIDRFSPSQPDQQMTASLLSLINAHSSMAQPLYYKDFPADWEDPDAWGIYDDFIHREMKPLHHDLFTDGPVLCVGASAAIRELLLAKLPPWQEVLADQKITQIPSSTILVFENYSLWARWDEQKWLFHGCLFWERANATLSHRFSEKMGMILIFDDVAASRLIGRKIQGLCEVHKKIGIVLRKGAWYRCQIRSSGVSSVCPI